MFLARPHQLTRLLHIPQQEVDARRYKSDMLIKRWQSELKSDMQNIINNIINMRDSLIGKPTITRKIQNAKLGACFLIATMLISVASIIVVSKIYSSRISEKIEDISYLKDANFKEWGEEPGAGKNTYTHTFRLYNYQGDKGKIEEDKFVLSDVVVPTKYGFRYEHASFGQGNKGVVNMINNWSRIPEEIESGTINNFNLGLNKVFNELTMEPIQSKFPVLFSRVLDTLQNQFLPDFYTQYLWQFFFQYKNLIVDTIFAPLKLDEALQQKLLNESNPYNWVSVEGMRPWIKLCISNYYITQSYFMIKSEFRLTSKQMTSLIGPKSQMHYLAVALNSTIKNKLHSMVKSLCAGSVCTDQELTTSQWASAFLSKTPLMDGINIDKLTGEVNATHRGGALQFFASCDFYGTACLQLNQSQELLTDEENNLLNFTFVNYIVENRQQPSIIEKLLNLEAGKGISIINYVSEYFMKEYTLGATPPQVFSWIWLVYQNFNRVWSQYLDFFINNLFGRAFYQKWADTKCTDYFQGDLEKYQTVCDKPGYKLGENVESYFPYINAYFYRDREAFLRDTEMSLEQSEAFFDNPNLFYVRMQQILSDFNAQYSCRDDLCTFEELAYRQWGSNDILSNLPTKYFVKKQASILDWDTNNLFKSFNIEYWSIISKKLSFSQVKKIMTNDGHGVLGQFSLQNRIDDRATKDPEQMIRYLNEVLITLIFDGHYVQKTAHEYLFGYPYPYLLDQKTKNPLEGGKPWVTGNVSLAALDNFGITSTMKTADFDQINSGIFDSNMIRVWKKMIGKNTTGYKHPVYILNDQLVYTWVDTCRLIEGTNMLGFHTSVTSSDTLKVFVEDLKSSVQFAYNSDVAANKHKFTPKYNTEYFVGNDTLDGLYARLDVDKSYLIVETATGQTIQSELVITWYIKPGGYIFNVDQNTKAYLYQQVIHFNRPSELKYQDIITTKHTKNTIIPILIASACVSFVGILIIAFFIWKWNKASIILQNDIDNRSSEHIDTTHQDPNIYV